MVDEKREANQCFGIGVHAVSLFGAKLYVLSLAGYPLRFRPEQFAIAIVTQLQLRCNKLHCSLGVRVCMVKNNSRV